MKDILNIVLRRPVSVFMFYLGLIILGLLSLGKLDISLLPPLEFPEITVHARYPGAMPEEVEHSVTRPLEEALSTVIGITDVISRSMQTEALLCLKLAWGTDMKYAALNVRQQVDRVYSYLPRKVLRPVVNLRNPQNRPILTIALSGKPVPELKRFAEYFVKKRLEQIAGVAEAAIMGAPEREIRVIVDPEALSNQGFGYDAVQRALKDNNILSGGGSIKRGNFRLAVRINSEYRSIEDVRNVPVFKKNSTFFVPLYKLAHIEDTFKEAESLTRINGKSCVAIDIRKESGTNTLDINEKIERIVKELNSSYPALDIDPVYSQAGFISETLNSVSYAIIIGAVLAIIVLFLFLSNWHAPFIISVSIPMSLLGAFLWMKFTGIGINVISLAGLALGGGMLVDNSIVTLENIYRHRENGEGLLNAAVLGVSEIAMPVTASTLTTIAVFIPVIYLNDLSAAVFTEQAKTVSYALITSLLVCFTLLPVLYLKLNRRKTEKKISQSDKSVYFQKLLNLYDRILSRILKNENTFLLIVIILFCLSVFLSIYLDRRLLPETEQHAVEISSKYIPGVTLEHIDKKMAQWENILMIDNRIVTIYCEMGRKPGVFLEPNERKINRSYSFLRLDKAVNTLNFLDHLVKNKAQTDLIETDFRKVEPVLSGLLGEHKAPLSLYISGPQLPVLDSLASVITSRIAQIYPNAVYASNYFERYPAISCKMDRIKLAKYGLTPADIAKNITQVLEGVIATQFQNFDRKIDITILGTKNLRSNLDDLLTSRINGYPLRDLVNISSVHEMSCIERKNHSRIFRIDMRSTNITQLADDLSAIFAEINLPHDYRFYMGGEWLDSRESLKYLLLAFILAVILVYLVLAAQFESFLAPFVIMFTVPLAIIGIVPALLITGMTINIMSAIGLIVVVGIVVNDGIIKIEFIRRSIREGMPVVDAIHHAGRLRLRPIIMTTVTTLIALLPLALGLGPGADLQQPMAIAIIGGEGLGTLLTVFILPVLYKKFSYA
jgi:HAE1 family hydrophobic/amphiphilic exporter-1